MDMTDELRVVSSAFLSTCDVRRPPRPLHPLLAPKKSDRNSPEIRRNRTKITNARPIGWLHG